MACDPDLEKGRWSDDSATQKNEDDSGDTTRERGNMLRCEGDVKCSRSRSSGLKWRRRMVVRFS